MATVPVSKLSGSGDYWLFGQLVTAIHVRAAVAAAKRHRAELEEALATDSVEELSQEALEEFRNCLLTILAGSRKG